MGTTLVGLRCSLESIAQVWSMKWRPSSSAGQVFRVAGGAASRRLPRRSDETNRSASICDHRRRVVSSASFVARKRRSPPPSRSEPSDRGADPIDRGRPSAVGFVSRSVPLLRRGRSCRVLPIPPSRACPRTRRRSPRSSRTSSPGSTKHGSSGRPGRGHGASPSASNTSPSPPSERGRRSMRRCGGRAPVTRTIDLCGPAPSGDGCSTKQGPAVNDA